MSLLLEILLALLLSILRGGPLQLGRLVVVKRFAVGVASMLRGCRFQEVRFVGLRGFEGVRAELGVRPAGAREAVAVRPIFGEVVEEAAWCTSISSFDSVDCLPAYRE